MGPIRRSQEVISAPDPIYVALFLLCVLNFSLPSSYYELQTVSGIVESECSLFELSYCVSVLLLYLVGDCIGLNHPLCLNKTSFM